MVLKLVRTDTVDASKIQIPVGEHLIGRGKLLDCDDKRISRQHAQLKVNNDSLVLRALHQNPCFITKKGSEEKEILKQDTETTLCIGDRFGMLPDAFWYEVLPVTDIDMINNSDTEKNTEEYCVEDIDYDTKKTEISCNNANNVKEQDEDVSPSLILTEKNNSVAELSNGTEPSSAQLTKSDSVLNKSTEVGDTADKAAIKQEIIDGPSNETNIQDSSKETIDESNSDESNMPSKVTLKRSHSLDNVDVKKVKKEADDVEINTGDANPGPSLDNGQAPAAQPSNDGPSNANNAVPGNNKPLRERCMYGANCYRVSGRPSSQQLEALAQFLEENPGIAKGLLRSVSGKKETKKKWAAMANTLNTMGGVIKDGQGWARYWAEKKYALKKQCVIQAASPRSSDGISLVPPLSELEKRLVAVIGAESSGTENQVSIPLTQDSLIEETIPIEPSPPSIQEVVTPKLNVSSSPSSSRTTVSRSREPRAPSRNLQKDMDRFADIEEKRVRAEMKVAEALNKSVNMLGKTELALQNMSNAISSVASAITNVAGAIYEVANKMPNNY